MSQQLLDLQLRLRPQIEYRMDSYEAAALVALGAVGMKAMDNVYDATSALFQSMLNSFAETEAGKWIDKHIIDYIPPKTVNPGPLTALGNFITCLPSRAGIEACWIKALEPIVVED